ncbi:MAG: recombinase family protein [Candidatus Aegiribacteria sp.]|nr:recombinase family protein [Candidatus Aegiribacteria sp.]
MTIPKIPRPKSSKSKKKKSTRDPKVAVIYCRVSSPVQVKKGFGLEAQERLCKKYCADEGLHVDKIFIELGISARESVKRPEYMRMYKYCLEHEKVSKIIVRDRDRYSADLTTVFAHIGKLRDAGVEVKDIHIDLDTSTAIGRKVEGDSWVSANYSRELGSERTYSTMYEARSHGYYMGSAPIGYITARSPDDHGSLAKDPDKAPLVQWAFHKVYEGGYSLNEILKYINTSGLRNRFNNKLSMKTLKDMLQNPIYAGYQFLEDKEDPVEGKWEPLISAEVFTVVSKRVGGVTRKKKMRKDDSWRYPLRRFLKCVKCGNLTGSMSKVSYPYYHCQTKKMCDPVRIPPSLLHAVFAFYLNGLGYKNIRYQLILAAVLELQKEKAKTYSKTVKTVKMRLSKLLEQRTATEYKLLHIDTIPEELCQRDLDRIDTEEAELKKYLNSLESRIHDKDNLLEFAQLILENLSRIWLLSSLEERQRLQSVLFPEPDGLRLDMEIGFMIPDSNLIFSAERSHTFTSESPVFSLKEFASFLSSDRKQSDSWEHGNIDE